MRRKTTLWLEAVSVAKENLHCGLVLKCEEGEAGLVGKLVKEDEAGTLQAKTASPN